MDRLKGKVALISGGARGQGAAEARLFAGEGAKVVIGDVLDEQCRKTAADINAKVRARSVIPLHLNVTRAADWRAAVESCQRECGGLDILVNNAGIANIKGIEETSEEEWDSIVNINQKGVWLGMKYAVPAMRQRGAGSIINISSIFGLVGSSARPPTMAPRALFAYFPKPRRSKEKYKEITEGILFPFKRQLSGP